MATTINPTKPEDVAEGTEKPKRQRKTERKPLYEVAEGAAKFTETPTDFNPDTHRMAKKHFVDIPTYMEHQAWIHEQRAVKLRAEAAEYRINPPKRAAGAKKAKLMEKLSKLEAKLKELGVNVEDLMKDDEASA